MSASTSTATVSKKSKRHWFKGLLFILAGLLIIGFIYQTVASLIDNQRYPPTGQMVDMGGYSLHIDCRGPAGENPTVVMDAGQGEAIFEWLPVTAQLSSDVRVCMFDRAGLGWSELGSQSPSVADRNEELHLLLQKAGVQPPYVMVGHSQGGAYAFAYLKRYPEETVGLVLVDPGNNSGTGLFDEWVANNSFPIVTSRHTKTQPLWSKS